MSVQTTPQQRCAGHRRLVDVVVDIPEHACVGTLLYIYIYMYRYKTYTRTEGVADDDAGAAARLLSAALREGVREGGTELARGRERGKAACAHADSEGAKARRVGVGTLVDLYIIYLGVVAVCVCV